MSLFIATLLPGLLLLVFAALLFWNGSTVGILMKAFPRSRRASYVLMAISAGWFLWHVAHLGEADFGQYRSVMLIGFGGVAVLSFKYAPDFLAVRGLSALLLLGAKPFLDAAFMHWQYPQRLAMVAFVYAAIVAAIFLAAYPYRMRDFFDWLFARRENARLVGAAAAIYGAALVLIAFSY